MELRDLGSNLVAGGCGLLLHLRVLDQKQMVEAVDAPPHVHGLPGIRIGP